MSRRDIQFTVGEMCHQILFKKLARIVGNAKTKDVRLQIMFCKADFIRLISNQDPGSYIKFLNFSKFKEQILLRPFAKVLLKILEWLGLGS